MITIASIAALVVAAALIVLSSVVREVAPSSAKYSPLRGIARWAGPAAAVMTVVALGLTAARIVLVAG